MEFVSCSPVLSAPEPWKRGLQGVGFGGRTKARLEDYVLLPCLLFLFLFSVRTIYLQPASP